MNIQEKKEMHLLFKAYKDVKSKEEKEKLYRKIYMKYSDLVKRIAFSILKNKDDSEDIMQNVFIKIYNMKIDNIPQKNEQSWLYTITKNTTIDYLRRKKNEINIDDIYSYQSKKDEIEEYIDIDTYKRLISKLTCKEQEIVSLKILSNLSFREIGVFMKLPTATVSWIYYKSIKTLKAFISNLLMTIIMITGYIYGKNNIPRAEFNPNIEIQKMLQKHNTINNTFLMIGLIFLLFTLYFFIILIKHHKNLKNSSSK